MIGTHEANGENGTTNPDTEFLLKKIAALEKENKELRGQSQHKTHLCSLSSPLHIPVPGKGQNDPGEPPARRTSLYFDGYRTRVDTGNIENQIIGAIPASQTEARKVVRGTSSPTSPVDDESDDLEDEDENTYLMKRYGGVDLAGNKNEETRRLQSTLTVPTARLTKPQDDARPSVERQVSVKFFMEDDRDIPDRDAIAQNTCTKGHGRDRDEKHHSDTVEGSKISVPEGKVKVGRSSMMSAAHDCSAGRDLSLRLHSSTVDHEIAVNSNGKDTDKRSSTVGNICDSFRNTFKDNVHFTIGENKTNRYNLDTMVQLEEMIERPLLNDGNMQSDLKDMGDFAVENPPSPRSKSEGNVSNRQLSAKKNIISSMSLIVKLSAMSKHLSAADSKSIQQRSAFSQFCLISVDPAVTLDGGSEWIDEGRRYLDPFIMKSAHCIDTFPSHVVDGGLDPNALSTFCFPEGVHIRLIPNAARAGALRLGLMGRNGDQYKFLAFTDGNGVTSYGVAITICEEVAASKPGLDSFIKMLQITRVRGIAAAKICRWWRLLRMPKSSAELSKKNSNMVSVAKKKVKSIPKVLHSKMKKRRSLDTPVSSRKSRPSVFRSIKKQTANSFPDGSLNKSDHLDESDYGTSLSLSNSISISSQHLGIESFESMQTAVRMGDACIIEKCYVITGVSQLEHFLQLRSLQHLVDMERSNDNTVENNAESHDHDVRHDVFDGNQILRHKFLHFIQKEVCLSPSQSRVKLPRNNFDIISQPHHTFDIELPALNKVTKLSIPLPPPQIAGHWGVANLLHRIHPDALLCILKLLLIERSVLVLGDSSDIITACTCALLELIQPFQWASNFIPLLPRDMLDFVNSPVPFVIGMMAKNQEHSLLLERDHRVIEAMSEGLSVMNLLTGTVHITAEHGIYSMIRNSPSPKMELSFYTKRLSSMRKTSKSLESFPAFINQGLSRKELVTLTATRRLIKSFVKNFAGEIASRPDGWQNYGEYAEEDKGGSFDFYPSMFVEPLRQQLESQLQLQDMMAHSQLFVEFVDQRRRSFVNQRELAKGDVGQFIAYWIYHHWELRKMMKASNCSHKKEVAPIKLKHRKTV